MYDDIWTRGGYIQIQAPSSPVMSSACLSFANWASTCEHQSRYQPWNFPRVPVWRNKLKASLGQEHWTFSVLVPSSMKSAWSIWCRMTLKNRQVWTSSKRRFLSVLWDDSLPGWSNGNSVSQTETARPYQETFHDPGASYRLLPWPHCEFWNLLKR